MKFRTFLATPLTLAMLILFFAQDTEQPKKIQRARRDVPCTVPAQVVGEKLADVKQVPKTDQPAQTAVEKHTIEKEKVIEIRYLKSADHDLNAHPVAALQFNSVPVAPGKSEIVTFGQTDLHSGANVQVEAGAPHPLELSEGQQLLAAGQQVKMGNYNSPQPAIMFRVIKTESPLTVHYLNPYELAVTTNGLNTGANPFFYWKSGNDFVEAKPEYLIRSQDSFTAILPYKPDGTSPDLYIVGKHAYSATVPLPKVESGKNEVKWNAGEKTQALIFDAKTNSYKVSDGNSESVDPLTAVQLQSNAKIDLPVREVVFASITPTNVIYPNPMPFAMNYTEAAAPGSSWVAGTLPALGMLGGGFLLYRAIDALTGKDSNPGTGTGTSQQPETSALVANPSTLAFNYTTGGNLPAPQSVAISSQKAASLDFTAASTATWLSINPAQGRTPSSLTATANLDGLAPGIYTAAINVMCPSNLQVTPTTVSVTLLVIDPSNPNSNPASLLPPFVNLATSPASGGFGPGGGEGITVSEDTQTGDVEKAIGKVEFEPAETPRIPTTMALCASSCSCEDDKEGSRCKCPAIECDKHSGPVSGDWSITIKGKHTKLNQVGSLYIKDNRLSIESALFDNGSKTYGKDAWTFEITGSTISYVGAPQMKSVEHKGRVVAFTATQDVEIHISGAWSFNPRQCDGLPHADGSGIKVKVSCPSYDVRFEEKKKVRKQGATILSEETISNSYFSAPSEKPVKSADAQGSVKGDGSARKCDEKYWNGPKTRKPKRYKDFPPGTFEKPNETITSTVGGNAMIYVKVTGKQYTPPATGAKVVDSDGTLRDTTSPVTLSGVAGVLVPIAGAATTYYFISGHDRKERRVPSDVPVIPAAPLSRGGTIRGANVTQPIATVADPGKRIVATSVSPTEKYKDGTPMKVDREFSDIGSVDGKSVYVSRTGDALKDGTKADVIEQGEDGTETKIGTVDGFVWVTELNTMTAEKQAVEGQPIQAAFKISGTPPVEQQTVQVILDPMLQLTGSLGLQNPTVVKNAAGQTVVTGIVLAGTTIVTVNANAMGDGGIQLVSVYVP